MTVIGPRLSIADVLATAAFVAGPRWRTVIEAVPGYAGLAIGPDSVAATSSGWPGSSISR